MADLARQLGVSMTTVSRALSDHYSIGPATKQRVQQMARELNYQPNQVASALRRGQSRLLGVVVPYIEGRFFPAVIQGIEQAASRAGFSVIVCQSHEDEQLERRTIDTLLHAQVAGVLVSLAHGTRQLGHFEKVRQRGVPLVFFDRAPTSGDTNAVVLDDRAGACQATRHLLRQGCLRIAHLAGPQHLSIYRERRQGYLDALQTQGLPTCEDLIIYSAMTVADGARAMHQLLALAQPPDAVFGAGDSAMLGALQAVRELGLTVPAQFALAGFSNEGFTTLTNPPLTSVDQRCGEMGAAAVRLLLELATTRSSRAAAHRVVLQPELLVRGSSLRTSS